MNIHMRFRALFSALSHSPSDEQFSAPILQSPNPWRKPDDDKIGNYQPPLGAGSPTSPSSGPSSSHTASSQQSGKCVYFQSNLENKKNSMLQIMSNFKSSFKNISSNRIHIICLFTILLALTMTKPFIPDNFTKEKSDLP